MKSLHLELNDPAFILNPYPKLEALRETAPVFWDEIWGKTFFLRYDDISALLRDRRLGRSLSSVLSRDELGFPPQNHPITLACGRWCKKPSRFLELKICVSVLKAL
jgi:cytochrome P450